MTNGLNYPEECNAGKFTITFKKSVNKVYDSKCTTYLLFILHYDSILTFKVVLRKVTSIVFAL